MASVLRRVGDGVERYGARPYAVRAALRVSRPFLTPLAARRLRAAASEAAEGSLDDLVEVAYTFDEFGIRIRPGQVRAEIRGLLSLVRSRGCKRVLEIGTHQGGSLFLLAQVAPPEAHILSIDLPRGAFGGGYARWRAPLYRRFGRRGQRIDLIRANSHDESTCARVRELLAGKPLDLLFIDGDHTYDGVRHDFELYRGLVRDGGLIALHDIAPGRASTEAEESRLLGGEVPQFWAELVDRYPTTELASSELGYYGIGVVHV